MVGATRRHGVSRRTVSVTWEPVAALGRSDVHEEVEGILAEDLRVVSPLRRFHNRLGQPPSSATDRGSRGKSVPKSTFEAGNSLRAIQIRRRVAEEPGRVDEDSFLEFALELAEGLHGFPLEIPAGVNMEVSPPEHGRDVHPEVDLT